MDALEVDALEDAHSLENPSRERSPRGFEIRSLIDTLRLREFSGAGRSCMLGRVRGS